MSLISALVGLAVAGVVTVAMMNTLDTTMRSQKRLELRADREAIKQLMLSAVSCTETIPPEGCAANEPVEVKRRTHSGDSRALVKIPSGAHGTRIGAFAVTAYCNADGDGIIVRAARLKKGRSFDSVESSDFVSDPITGKIGTWQDDDSRIFPKDADLCSGTGGSDAKGVAMKIGTSSISTNSASFSSTGDAVTLTTTGGKVMVMANLSGYFASDDTLVQMAISENGGVWIGGNGGGGDQTWRFFLSTTMIFTPPAGTHTYSLGWRTQGYPSGTRTVHCAPATSAMNGGGFRQIIAFELK